MGENDERDEVAELDEREPAVLSAREAMSLITLAPGFDSMAPDAQRSAAGDGSVTAEGPSEHSDEDTESAQT